MLKQSHRANRKVARFSVSRFGCFWVVSSAVTVVPGLACLLGLLGRVVESVCQSRRPLNDTETKNTPCRVASVSNRMHQHCSASARWLQKSHCSIYFRSEWAGNTSIRACAHLWARAAFLLGMLCESQNFSLGACCMLHLAQSWTCWIRQSSRIQCLRDPSKSYYAG